MPVPPRQPASALPLRLACVAATAAAALTWSKAPPVFVSAVYSIGLAHYLLALRYSASQLRQISESRLQQVWLAGLVLLAVALYQLDVSLIVYFGIHHALNEAYARRGGLEPRLAGLGAPAAVLHGLAYVAMLGWSPRYIGVDPVWLWVGLAVAGALYIRAVLQLRSETRTSSLLEVCAPEIAAAAMVALSLFVRLTFLQIVLYHFLVWAVLPVGRIRQRRAGALAEYLGLSAAIVVAALMLSPIGPRAMRLSSNAFTQQFFFWSYMHITLSFGLSDAHPAWLVRLRRGAPRSGGLPTIRARPDATPPSSSGNRASI